VYRNNPEESDQIIFENADERYTFVHHQDCCEHVYIEDICGDLSDLEGVELAVADEVVNRPELSEDDEDYYHESQTYTFYKFRTIKGSVDIRWHGSSNGYYSESVDLDHEKL
jgi:hypothetical protein